MCTKADLFKSKCPAVINQLNLTVAQVSSVENKVQLYEQVSLVFLLYDESKKALSVLATSPKQSICNWCIQRSQMGDPNWKTKLLEAFTLTQNYTLHQELGLNKFDAMDIFLVNQPSKTICLNPVKKILYLLFEQMPESKAKLFLQKMGVKDTSGFLEVHLLKWIEDGVITLSTSGISPIKESLRQLNETHLVWFLDWTLGELGEEGVSEVTTSSAHQGDFYEILNKQRLGLCAILNQESFEGQPERNRAGSAKDCESLREVMEGFNFDIQRLNNVNGEDVCDELSKLIQNHFFPQVHSIFFLVILSHGIQGAIYGVDNELVSIEEIKKVLLHPHLSKKPKVLVIQACQGTNFYKVPELEADGPSHSVVVSDLLTCYATSSGCIAIRHVEKGSWYIQALCKVLQSYPDEDLFSIFTRVNKELKKNKAPIPGGYISMLSEFSSSLSKKIFLRIK